MNNEGVTFAAEIQARTSHRGQMMPLTTPRSLPSKFKLPRRSAAENVAPESVYRKKLTFSRNAPVKSDPTAPPPKG